MRPRRPARRPLDTVRRGSRRPRRAGPADGRERGHRGRRRPGHRPAGPGGQVGSRRRGASPRRWPPGSRRCPVRLVDERFTTVLAHAALQQGGLDGPGPGGRSVDKAAAALLLQGALDTERSTGQPAGELVAACPPEGGRIEPGRTRGRLGLRTQPGRQGSRVAGPTTPSGAGGAAATARPTTTAATRCRPTRTARWLRAAPVSGSAAADQRPVRPGRPVLRIAGPLRQPRPLRGRPRCQRLRRQPYGPADPYGPPEPYASPARPAAARPAGPAQLGQPG